MLVGDTLDGGGIGAPSDGHNTFLRDQSLVGTVNSLLKPNVVNTFLVQYARRHYNFPAVTGQPNLDLPNELSFGHNFGTFDALDESRQQISDSIAWIKGTHYLKAGVDTNFIQNFVIWPGFTPMRIVLPGDNCLVDFANFVNPTADIAGVPGPPCPTASAPPSGPGPNPNDPLNGVPIVFWGAPVGTGPITPGQFAAGNSHQLSECVCRSSGLRLQPQPRLFRLVRAGPVADQPETNRSTMDYVGMRNLACRRLLIPTIAVFSRVWAGLFSGQAHGDSRRATESSTTTTT